MGYLGNCFACRGPFWCIYPEQETYSCNNGFLDTPYRIAVDFWGSSLLLPGKKTVNVTARGHVPSEILLYFLNNQIILLNGRPVFSFNGQFRVTCFFFSCQSPKALSSVSIRIARYLQPGMTVFGINILLVLLPFRGVCLPKKLQYSSLFSGL